MDVHAVQQNILTLLSKVTFKYAQNKAFNQWKLTFRVLFNPLVSEDGRFSEA